jgi:hypothetical protein
MGVESLPTRVKIGLLDLIIDATRQDFFLVQCISATFTFHDSIHCYEENRQ